MDMNFSALQEPRGVMRVIQFIFSICAFATTCNFSGFIDFHCTTPSKFIFGYPYDLNMDKLSLQIDANCHPTVSIYGDFSSDARFFVATGVISMLYCIFIILLYTKFDEMYKTNEKVPLIDFSLSVVIAVLWLSSSASWANALTGLKHVTDPEIIEWENLPKTCSKCPISVGSMSSLNISVILGFLNFFLWAADLWFLYKETAWFQNAQIPQPEI